jgi:hypothetical protein
MRLEESKVAEALRNGNAEYVELEFNLIYNNLYENVPEFIEVHFNYYSPCNQNK